MSEQRAKEEKVKFWVNYQVVKALEFEVEIPLSVVKKGDSAVGNFIDYEKEEREWDAEEYDETTYGARRCIDCNGEINGSNWSHQEEFGGHNVCKKCK